MSDRRSTGDAVIGRVIAGKYTIESRVGGGGMGSVYKAKQAGLNKVIAIKLLHRELLAEPTFASRFKREATAASRIDHTNSLRVVDFGEEADGLLYIAMEFLEGKSLFKILKEEAPLAPSRIVDLSRQILAALAAAHDLGIVHRDLKPENVIVLSKKDDDGGLTEVVKVCDFGIAKLAVQGETDEKLTVEGTIVGTPEYLSPEQARGGEIDLRSDLYSMGVILFEMLTARPPFKGDTPLATVLKHLDDPIPVPSTFVEGVDAKIEAVCLKALAKSPADRYASARAMRTALAVDATQVSLPSISARESSPGKVVVRTGVEPRSNSALMMAETPPAVSSTPAPLQLTRARQETHRPRLADVTARPQESPRWVMGVVVALALAGGGAGAYLLRKKPVVAAELAKTAAPPEQPAAASAPADSALENAPAPPPLESSAIEAPPSELAPRSAPSASAVATHHTHRAAKEGHEDKGQPGESIVVSDTPPPPPPSPASATKVRFSNVRADNVASADLVSALPSGRFASCYHGAPGSHATLGLHLDMTSNSTQARCAIADGALAELAGCVSEAAKHVTVPGMSGAKASADVQVDFDTPK